MSRAAERAAPRRTARRPRALGLALAVLCTAAHAARGDALDPVVVTATRIPERLLRIPADLSVVTGEELDARGAADLAGALALVPGVDAPAGGDAGPSSAVPAFWGLHEFDAFLLVVDGVPWGGAFNPAIDGLDLNDVERIEVLKGAAPVIYGATAFVGVVQVLHYPAGRASERADLAYGDHGSLRGSAAFALPSSGRFRQSLAVDGERERFADPRERVAHARFLYRGAIETDRGRWSFDADGSLQRDRPPSPVLRAGAALPSATPVDANFNPRDARIDTDRYRISAGYARPTPAGEWSTRVSLAHAETADVRAFLHPDSSGTADTQDQRRRIDDDYLDSHLSSRLGADTRLIVGVDVLYGRGRQVSRNGNGAYTVPLDGSVIPPPAAAAAIDEIGTLDDRRAFAGQYAQIDWGASRRWDVIAGVRLNETDERKTSSDLSLPPPRLESARVRRRALKPSETLGASWRAWRDGADRVVLYADYRSTFKPAAIDFGPDYTPDVLAPETAQSYEAGLRGVAGHGRLSYQAEAFRMNFENLVVATPAGSLVNAGRERLQGVEIESRWQAGRSLVLALTGAYHDARYEDYVFSDGVDTVNVAGRRLPLSPRVQASAGILYTPPRGFGGTLVANYVGRRFLDELNEAATGGYTRLDASIGYRFGRYRVSLEGSNVTDRRPPVSASEFGSESFYVLAPRRVWLRVGCALGR